MSAAPMMAVPEVLSFTIPPTDCEESSAGLRRTAARVADAADLWRILKNDSDIVVLPAHCAIFSCLFQARRRTGNRHQDFLAVEKFA
jgi:hypothetical protein